MFTLQEINETEREMQLSRVGAECQAIVKRFDEGEKDFTSLRPSPTYSASPPSMCSDMSEMSTSLPLSPDGADISEPDPTGRQYYSCLHLTPSKLINAVSATTTKASVTTTSSSTSSSTTASLIRTSTSTTSMSSSSSGTAFKTSTRPVITPSASSPSCTVHVPNFSDTVQKYEQAQLEQHVPSIRDNCEAHDLPIPHSPAPIASMAVPAMSYNNPISATYEFAPLSVRMPITQAGSITQAGTAAHVSTAIVYYMYISSLPDELLITLGEMVHIVSKYDDGWVLYMARTQCCDRALHVHPLAA
ncbi:hypothetical protein NEOLEDRAFT_1184561 [Neolentinus lepideus HHB14362 ss-1]|uniref:SH3 domain-containing protein n=1 Tax=Neolentinus lepideus HHB14362 ss-1 TaxID=1314782 RepID=A0A165MBA7_9AGAM|nr:hypothetical protein NEOLEDRAFT_1184561 [Neolentinus lepideus HHB14362 ss-1]